MHACNVVLLFCHMHACHYASVPEANAESVCIAYKLKYRVALPVQQQSTAVQALVCGANTPSLCKGIAVSKKSLLLQQ